MVSLQLTNWSTVVPGADPSRKRKRDDDRDGEVHAAAKELRLWCTGRGDAAAPPSRREVLVDDIELQLEDSPLPPEWQRCLDIKSGQIHFYNTSTQKRTSRDPRLTIRAEPPPPNPPRPALPLDLDLNLGCESSTEREEEDRAERGRDEGLRESGCRSEMMAAVCMRCHMLVMMCRSTPACPNCKFLHPPPPDRRKAATATPPPEKPGFPQIGMLKSILAENSISSFK